MAAVSRLVLLAPFAAAMLAQPGLAAEGAAPADFIAVSAAQGQALGILTQRVAAPGSATAAGLPAMVSIPNAQQRVVAAPLAGVVDSLAVAPGQNVKKGQLLARLTSPQALELQRDRLQAEAQAGLARQSLARDEQLFREGLIAESRLQASRANAAQSAAQATERRQALALAQAGSGQTLTLVAPIAGNVLEQHVAVGQRVEQAAPLYRIASLDPLAVDIQAPLAVARLAKVGTRLTIPGSAAGGELITIGRAVDPATQSVLLRGLVRHGAENLRPGQATVVDLALEGSAQPATVQVPAAAILHHQGRQWVFIAARDGQRSGYRALPVGVHGRLGEASLVSGLPADAQVVSAGTAALKANWLGVGQ